MISNFILTIMQVPPPRGSQNADYNLPKNVKDPFDLAVFVILPLVLIVGYIIWRTKRREP
ncbi:MAG: hypothetical protein COA80_16320 [Leeuwenhoekiella sp.]|nr:MAG: hypothetical protein COA80_16320 [Leeuwenhoekiella sp.]